MDLLDELEKFEEEENSPKNISAVIIHAMSTGLSRDAIAGLLDMTLHEFEKLAEKDKEIQRALEIGDAKLALYLERLALASARDNSNILLSILRTRLGWDKQDPEQAGSLIVEVKKFVDSAKKKDSDPK